jgi:hypothetical protein
MTKLRIKKRKLLAAIVGIAILTLVAVYVYDRLTNPYSGRELSLQRPPSDLQFDKMTWATSEKILFNARGGDYFDEPVAGLPSDDHIYFTNVHIADEYQFVQTGTHTWTDSQRLFWRKDSKDSWREIKLTEKDVDPSGFVSMDGRHYLAAVGGLIAEDRFLYLIDIEKGTLEKQFEAYDLVISPDKSKIISVGGSIYGGPYSILVWDFTDDTKTLVTSILEQSPGSGRSFDYRWSSDSKFIEIEGSSHKHPRGFRYIYEHSTKKLYDA